MIFYVCAFAFCLYFYWMFQKNRNIYKYWEKKSVLGPKPIPLIGNLLSVYRQEDSINTLVEKYYNEYPNEKFVGIYQGTCPILILRDPSLFKQVTVKDFSAFTGRGLILSEEELSHNLFSEEGDKWKVLRHRLSPMFTAGKLKLMVPLINNCVTDFIDYINSINKDGKTISHEIRDLSGRYTLKGITSCALGIDVDTFAQETSIFSVMAQKVMKPNMKIIAAAIVDSIFPGVTLKLPLKLMDQDVVHFFRKLTNEIVQEREGKRKMRNDFMDLLIEMKEEGKVTKTQDDGVAELDVTIDTMVAQVFIFYLAGYETSSGTMSFMLFELAQNPEVQERCYEEVKRVIEKYNHELTYDSLNELIYLSMTFDETLRKYPVVGILMRRSNVPYTFPGTNLTIGKGTKVFIPIPAVQSDPKYFPNPEKFDPERFSSENIDKILPGTYSPFGDGPRICIGLRFAKVQVLLSIAHLIYNFRIEKTSETIEKIKFDPTSLTLNSLGGIWLRFKKRN